MWKRLKTLLRKLADWNESLVTLGHSLKPIEKGLPFNLPMGLRAIVLWPFILYAPGMWAYGEPTALRQHELYHWREIARIGPLFWYPLYLAFEGLRSVMNVVRKNAGKEALPSYWHPMERGAYRVQWVLTMQPELVAKLDAFDRKDVFDEVVSGILEYLDNATPETPEA